jgi:enoyl-CoA hydratase/carnithine racemase
MDRSAWSSANRILLMGLDRREKYNGLTPKMMRELGHAYTRLDEDPELWVGVLFGHGKHFTAGLDLPKWTEGMKGSTGGASATAATASTRWRSRARAASRSSPRCTASPTPRASR